MNHYRLIPPNLTVNSLTTDWIQFLLNAPMPANEGLMDWNDDDDDVSDIVQIRLIRDTDNDSGLFGGADGLAGSVYIYDLDIHKETDAMGSRQEYYK